MRESSVVLVERARGKLRSDAKRNDELTQIHRMEPSRRESQLIDAHAALERWFDFRARYRSIDTSPKYRTVSARERDLVPT